MASPSLLWLDFRQHPHDAGHYPLLLPTWAATRCVRPGDAATAIRGCWPQFVCFEFDTPTADDLAALQKARLQHPSLPILMLADRVSPSLEEWVFRIGIWDYLVIPVPANDLNARIEAFAHFCQQRHQGAACDDTSHGRPPRQPRTQPACDYVAQHYADEIRLPLAASLCCLSESEFSRCFKKENGLTFCEYLMHWRLQKACELLGEPGTPVKTVAFEVGFNDVSYFARAFRHHTGMTPSAYQRVADAGGRIAPTPADTAATPPPLT